MVVLLLVASPLIALYEYDQQNEPTPNLTPEHLWGYATWGIPLLAGLLLFAFLGPLLRRKKLELTPGIVEIDKVQVGDSKEQRLLGDEHLSPRRHHQRLVDGGAIEGGERANPGDFGKIVSHRSSGGRRLGIVYRGDAATPTLRRKRRRHQRKRGPKRGWWHSLRRALGFSRKGRNRPAWWRAWLRIS